MAKKQDSKVDIAESAHKIWLAGLGALGAAGDEGEKLFDALVQRGEKLEKQAGRPVGKASAKVRGTVSGARARAGETFDSISTAIDDAVAVALHRIGVPTRDEIASLGKRVDKLTLAVEGRNKPRAAVRKTARKTVAKKTPKRRATA